MLVIYTPEDGEPETWTWNPGRVLTEECAIVEKVYDPSGKTPWDKFAADAQQNFARAKRVLLWHLRRRAHPFLRFEDTPDFYADQLTFKYDLAELRALRDSVVTAGVTDAEREIALAALDQEIAEAEAKGAVGEGKAPLSSDS